MEPCVHAHPRLPQRRHRVSIKDGTRWEHVTRIAPGKSSPARRRPSLYSGAALSGGPPHLNCASSAPWISACEDPRPGLQPVRPPTLEALRQIQRIYYALFFSKHPRLRPDGCPRAYASCSLPPQHVKAIIEKEAWRWSLPITTSNKQRRQLGWQQIKSCHVTFVRAT